MVQQHFFQPQLQYRGNLAQVAANRRQHELQAQAAERAQQLYEQQLNEYKTKKYARDWQLEQLSNVSEDSGFDVSTGTFTGTAFAEPIDIKKLKASYAANAPEDIAPDMSPFVTTADGSSIADQLNGLKNRNTLTSLTRYIAKERALGKSDKKIFAELKERNPQFDRVWATLNQDATMYGDEQSMALIGNIGYTPSRKPSGIMEGAYESLTGSDREGPGAIIETPGAFVTGSRIASAVKRGRESRAAGRGLRGVIGGTGEARGLLTTPRNIRRRAQAFASKNTQSLYKAIGGRSELITDAVSKKNRKALKTLEDKLAKITKDGRALKGKGAEAKKLRRGIKATTNKIAKTKTLSTMKRQLGKYIEKKGVSGLLKAVAKKGGWKAATKIGAKFAVGQTAKAATPVTAGLGLVAGLAMDAWTVYDIYDLLSDTLEAYDN